MRSARCERINDAIDIGIALVKRIVALQQFKKQLNLFCNYAKIVDALKPQMLNYFSIHRGMLLRSRCINLPALLNGI